MSPEQIDGTELDSRSDLRSRTRQLGVLTGRRPWEGEGLYSVIFKQKREELPPIDELRPDAPDRLIYLVEGAIRKSPGERWRSAGEMVAEASTIAPDGGWARWHTERRKRRRAVVYSAARDRGDSVLSAALETMRFRRDGSVPGIVAPETPSAARRSVPWDDGSAAIPVRAEVVDRQDKPRRSVLSVLVVTAVVAAAIVGSLRVMRGRSGPATDGPAPTTFADNGGVEVPLARTPGAPNASPVGGTTPDSVVAAAAQPPASTADSSAKPATPNAAPPRDSAPTRQRRSRRPQPRLLLGEMRLPRMPGERRPTPRPTPAT
jgi:hypothetical protein